MKQRIGIYAGTFDPVHSGHISFALQAIEDARLEGVCIVPERTPRNKPNVEHYGHRTAMITRAILPHSKLSLLEVVDKQFTVHRTLPKFRHIFPDMQLVFLMGADVFMHVPDWKGLDILLDGCEFVVAVRSKAELAVVLQIISKLRLTSKQITIVDSLQPEVSSSHLRRALQKGEQVTGLLPSVRRYAQSQWLYVRIPKVNV